ncbi:hypothetical protein I5G63_gp012 [Mycobacterium phage Imvubu]|uniref:Uncharacterized protein n=1 Tax=Mycobacterium phage Imvubu TaxID=2686233 RepID=A0A6B9L9Y4_9CAUD|nr:hypothetical protein I5G63_gp012 [Mycobacterium phage Imvubu]QHB37753.1 hypothetical protein PBI_IMVUBU_12 [Mycobacterium phage Imvubu]
MNQADRLALADKLAAEHTRYVDFVRTATVLLGLLPMMYGGLTWVYGDRLWAGNAVYGTAMGVPGAPQSWGVLFVTLGVGVIASARLGRRRCIAGFTLASALMLAMFMVTFLTEVVGNGQVQALPPALVYGIVSLLFLSRSRMAWVGRRPRRQKGSAG